MQAIKLIIKQTAVTYGKFNNESTSVAFETAHPVMQFFWRGLDYLFATHMLVSMLMYAN